MYICLWYKIVIYFVYNLVDSCLFCFVFCLRKKEEEKNVVVVFLFGFYGKQDCDFYFMFIVCCRYMNDFIEWDVFMFCY